MGDTIGSVLAALRREQKFMQKDVALKLADYGFKVNAKTIYNWEKSVSQPNINQFLALCDILKVDDVLWQFAGINKGRYAGLNIAGRKKALEFIELLLQIDQYRGQLEVEATAAGGINTASDINTAIAAKADYKSGHETNLKVGYESGSVSKFEASHEAGHETGSGAGHEPNPESGVEANSGKGKKAVRKTETVMGAAASAMVPAQRMLRLYDIPASAGAGNFLDDSGFVMIEAPGFVPDAVDFALRVSGDSMEPLFRDGQMIWIKKQEVFKHGDIGIFVFSGDVYCKKLIIEGKKAFLRSVNPAYDDIEVIEDLGFKAIGVVVS